MDCDVKYTEQPLAKVKDIRYWVSAQLNFILENRP